MPASKKTIRIRFQNGLSYDVSLKEILSELTDEFDFIESENPDFIIFGPYGNDIPPKGNYTRIGYFCENITPDFSICEWAFGIPREEEIGRDNYKRIQWHGFSPNELIKGPDYDAEKILASKTKFCCFLYSHKVPYREAFFNQLSKYKRVDAPGKSMNNMPSIDTMFTGGKWEVKRQFLSSYKFTIAFENDIFPGYQTEKLYDAMLADCMPIYCGDPFIGEVFNTESFIHAGDLLHSRNKWLCEKLTKLGRMDFDDIRPQFLKTPVHRVKRKVKAIIRGAKLDLQVPASGFGPIIDTIIALDKDDDLYLKHLKQPWFKNDAVPENTSSKKRWIEIFNSR